MTDHEAGERPTGDALDPATLDRLFDVLDAGAGSDDALSTAEQDQLLSVLEAALLSPARLDGDELDQLLSVLESAVVDPASPETAEEALSVLESAVVNPARLERTETDGILSVLESAVVDPTDPGSTARDVFSLADAVGLGGPAPRDDAADTAAPDTAESDAVGPDGVAPSGSTAGDDRDGGLDRQFRLARLVAAATLRSTDYSLRSGVRVGTGLVRAVRESESPATLVEELRAVAFEELDRLGVDTGESDPGRSRGKRSGTERPPDADALRERGKHLLELSADVDHDESVHPAFPRVLDELAADEARILRLLATEGPQPVVDVRDAGYLPISSTLVATRLSMIGPEAGCRHEDRAGAYLTNLERLGLVRVTDEPLADASRYQVLLAQPHVAAAVDDCRRANADRRRVRLTPFGAEFCRVCLPVDVSPDAAGPAAVPEDDTE
jgi:hypothetical protein